MAFARPQAIQQFAPIGDDGTDGQAILVDTTGRILAVIQTALPTGDLVIGRVKITNGTDVAQVSAAGELSVNVGNAGDIGGGTQYTEDAPAAADPIGTALIMVRDDALSAQTTADGDNVAVRGTDKGELYVKHADTMVVDGSAVTQPVSLASVPSHAVTSGATRTYKTYSATISADTDIIAAVASKRIKVYAYSITTVSATENSIIFKSNGTAGTELWRVDLQAPASVVAGANLAVAPGLDGAFLFATVACEKLTADLGAAVAIHISVAYWDDDAA